MGFNEYKGSIKLGAGLTPAGDGYPLIQTCDILAGDNDLRLDEFLKNLNLSGGGNSSRIAYVTLTGGEAGWTQTEVSKSLYSQVVEIEGVTENTKVDLTPSAGDLVDFYEKDLSFVTENDDCVVTVYCIGQMPEKTYTIQVTLTEVGNE